MIEMYPDRCGTHPPFDVRAGDRVRREQADAEALAAEREPRRGPQTVTLHSGWLLKDVWFVQDAREPSPPAP